MDDSDQDFSFLCSRLLKRVRRKAGESGDEKKTVVKDEGEDEDSGSRIQSRSKAPCKRKREKKGGVQSERTDRIRTDGLVNGASEPAVVGEGEQKVTAAVILCQDGFFFFRRLFVLPRFDLEPDSLSIKTFAVLLI